MSFAYGKELRAVALAAMFMASVEGAQAEEHPLTGHENVDQTIRVLCAVLAEEDIPDTDQPFADARARVESARACLEAGVGREIVEEILAFEARSEPN